MSKCFNAKSDLGKLFIEKNVFLSHEWEDQSQCDICHKKCIYYWKLPFLKAKLNVCDKCKIVCYATKILIYDTVETIPAS